MSLRVAIATLGGYGNPPGALLRHFIDTTHFPYSTTKNPLYLTPNLFEPEKVYLKLGNKWEVSFNTVNQVVN
jgi:hypothetical protein